MPSVARKYQLGDSLVYHVLNRGNGRRKIFQDPVDFDRFKTLLAAYAKEHGASVYHWALMPNHYHLCMQLTHPERLSGMLAGFQRAYVHYHHRKHNSAGSLFQGRFKSRPIGSEQYFVACGRYIERNPVKAGLVDRPEAYLYGSARFYILGDGDGLTTPSPMYENFGMDEEQRRRAYRRFIGVGDDAEETLFERMDQPLGDEAFVERLMLRRGRFIRKRRGKARRKVSVQ
jgi:putative transposase